MTFANRREVGVSDDQLCGYKIDQIRAMDQKKKPNNFDAYSNFFKNFIRIPVAYLFLTGYKISLAKI